MELTTLPDDALLQVLRYLDIGELLQCRLVCRRLRDAALHPDLWRKRSLTLTIDQDDGVTLVSAALRLAPCLGRLSLASDTLEDLERIQLPGGSLMTSTGCAISELAFDLHSIHADLAASAIARQAALGRLHSVSVTVDETSPEVRILFDQLLHTHGLTSLGLGVHTLHTVDYQSSGGAVPSSLQRLQYDIGSGGPGPLSSLLQWHADTLQVVHLDIEPIEEITSGTAALLVALPNLRELKCPILDDMPALLQCPALTTLHLFVWDADRDDWPRLRGAQQYLRKATACLEALTLEYGIKIEEDDEFFHLYADALHLVQNLAGPDGGASPALRSLRLTFGGTDIDVPQPQLPALASVLHRLTHVVSLDLGGPPTAALVEAMDGQVLPRLQRLRVAFPLGSDGCPHAWAHGQEPRGLLKRYPRLHVELESDHRPEYRGVLRSWPLHVEPETEHRATSCGYCRANSCHVFEGDAVHTLFSHPEHDGQCEQVHRGKDMRIVL